MESLRELYRIGRGPSSSHTIAPTLAAEIFAAETKDAAGYRVTLYGSLSKSGKGHMTDVAILDVLGSDKCEMIFSDTPDEELPHPNTMFFEALDAAGSVTCQMEIYSVGGGRIAVKGQKPAKPQDVFAFVNMFMRRKAKKFVIICMKSGTR